MSDRAPAALEEWVALGLSDATIARRAHVDPRTVLRWRQRRGLASQWTPPREERHGTLARYRQGCACGDCRAANVVEAIRYRRRQNTATRHAPNYGRPWSPEDDRELAQGEGTVADRAARLGRTWSAATQRLDQLRRAERDHHTRQLRDPRS